MKGEIMDDKLDERLNAFNARNARKEDEGPKHRPKDEPKGPLTFVLKPLPPAIKIGAKLPETMTLADIEKAFVGWSCNQDLLYAVVDDGGLRDIVLAYWRAKKADLDRMATVAEAIARKIRKLHKQIQTETMAKKGGKLH